MTSISSREGRAGFGAYETWYRISGDLGAGKPPVVILHGGPGVAHNYVDSYKLLALQGRAVIHYDQIGCGNSTLLPEKGADFWTPQLFIDELENLVDHLGIRPAFHVLGQSWGGMLGAEYGVTRPKGLKSLTIANSPASMKLWVEEANRLRADMPVEIQDALNRHEKAGTTSDPEYQQATMAFYERHVCRVVPFPPEVTETFEQVARNPTVYNVMNGPNEFFVIGTLKTWSIIDRLPAIEVPTLIISGRHDEATPATVQPYKDGIKGSRWEIFEHSSHMPHVEEKEKCMQVVGAFLDQHDF
ncbi:MULTISPECIES: proline iminopeptidase-family hydrolase [unclassified Mesorhizobium]|uniref:proline iminopeptidase-family hydrolase n=1 Tax=unclassified Mesorhizobium TaxID=325217 RepID=UPI0009603140|nr:MULTISPECIES: proline iminopeptidase-family hydrolase [unclassified Mesorhizobium]MBN9254710.1 proline iminopeptidase-family hydrolase [Mesorhizobium sp.]MBN9273202.1 proline iminopeptidase-family hydrolase [Mesorhizobium sp.]OJX70774.1 MAG: amino acid amidase [Mesorhizobium sp. 65-26]